MWTISRASATMEATLACSNLGNWGVGWKSHLHWQSFSHIGNLFGVYRCYSQWNSASLRSTNISIKGAALKRSTEFFSMAKIMSIKRACLAETLWSVQKIHFLFNKTKVYVVNWLTWHYKLQYLFCGALYKYWKCIKMCCSIAWWDEPQISISYKRLWTNINDPNETADHYAIQK